MGDIMKQRRYPKKIPSDPDWVTSVPHNEEHCCELIIDWSDGPKSEPVICGRNADVLVWWDHVDESLALCFECYEGWTKGRKTLNEYGKKG
jgi:hypothetical protein